MTLTTLREEARKFFSDKCPLHKTTDCAGCEKDGLYLDSIIDRTYHATKEEVRGIVKGELPDLSEFEGTDRSLRFWQGYRKGLEFIIAALEDTTTSPDVS